MTARPDSSLKGLRAQTSDLKGVAFRDCCEIGRFYKERWVSAFRSCSGDEIVGYRRGGRYLISRNTHELTGAAGRVGKGIPIIIPI